MTTEEIHGRASTEMAYPVAASKGGKVVLLVSHLTVGQGQPDVYQAHGFAVGAATGASDPGDA